MLSNEKGFIYLPILLLSSLLFFYLTESIPLFLSFHQMTADEWGKLQAESNAEAGIWIALEESSKHAESYLGDRYPLSKGEVQVIISHSTFPMLRISSIGSVPPHYKREMIVTYDPSLGKVISWQR